MQTPTISADYTAFVSHNDDHRRYPRHLVYWPAVIFPGDPSVNEALLQGKTCDISMGGAAILSEKDFALKLPVIMQLTIPPQLTGEPGKLINIKCIMVQSYLDGRHNLFRIGFCFDEMCNESKVVLYDTLSDHPPAPY